MVAPVSFRTRWAAFHGDCAGGRQRRRPLPLPRPRAPPPPPPADAVKAAALPAARRAPAGCAAMEKTMPLPLPQLGRPPYWLASCPPPPYPAATPSDGDGGCRSRARGGGGTEGFGVTAATASGAGGGGSGGGDGLAAATGPGRGVIGGGTDMEVVTPRAPPTPLGTYGTPRPVALPLALHVPRPRSPSRSSKSWYFESDVQTDAA